MRIGLVSKWFASGQGVVARQLRSALVGLGHQTFILARPGRGPRAARRAGSIDREDPAWRIPEAELTEATAHAIPAREYLEWAERHGLDAVFCDENYDFEAVGSLRRRGVRTLGRFVWESFLPADAAGAHAAYDRIFSLTRCERDRYAGLGIESPLVRWGIHPELLAAAADASERDDDELIRFLFPCSFLSPRKPVRAVLEAFRAVPDRRIELTLSAQLPRRANQLERAVRRDPRISLELRDLPTAAYLGLFGSADVCLAPSRWEGLGVPLFEATAFGLPIVTNDAAPMNEVVVHDHNGALVRSTAGERTKSGIRAQEVDVGDLAAAIRRLADDDERARLSAGARRRRSELPWSRTIEDVARLLEP